MPNSPKSQVLTDRPLVAIGLFSVAMMIFSSTDGAAKYLSSEITPQQIIFLRYVIVLITMILLFCICRGQRNLFNTAQPKLQILRGLFSSCSGSLIICFALKHLPLELCAAISFVSPLFVTALSIPLLGERVGLRRWIAVLIGLLSVLIILRPGGASFQLAMLLPLASSLCWAMGLILTRLMRDSEEPLTVLAWSSLVGVVAISAARLACLGDTKCFSMDDTYPSWCFQWFGAIPCDTCLYACVCIITCTVLL